MASIAEESSNTRSLSSEWWSFDSNVYRVLFFMGQHSTVRAKLFPSRGRFAVVRFHLSPGYDAEFCKLAGIHDRNSPFPEAISLNKTTNYLGRLSHPLWSGFIHFHSQPVLILAFFCWN